MESLDFVKSGGHAYLAALLTDGRVVFTPLSWYPAIERATPKLRARWLLIGGGRGVSWPDLDVDLSIAGMLAGIPDLTHRAQATSSGAEYSRALRRVLASRPRKAG